MWYKYKVEERRGTGKHRHWVTMSKGSCTNEFHLEDQSGRIRVNPMRVTPDVRLVHKERSGWTNDPSPNVKRFLSRQGLAYEGFLGINRTMRFTEWLVRPTQSIYVLGTAAKDHMGRDKEVPYIIKRGGVGTPFLMSTRTEQALFRSLVLKSVGVFFCTAVCWGAGVAIILAF